MGGTAARWARRVNASQPVGIYALSMHISVGVAKGKPMEKLVLKAVARKPGKKGASRKLRAAGSITVV